MDGTEGVGCDGVGVGGNRGMGPGRKGGGLIGCWLEGSIGFGGRSGSSKSPTHEK